MNLFLDHPPPPRKKFVSRKQMQKIVQGGKKADQIRTFREEDHQNREIPLAEKKISQQLQKWEKEKNYQKNNFKKSKIKKISFCQKILNFIKKFS